MNGWRDSPRLTDEAKRALGQIFEQIEDNLTNALFERALDILAKGPIRYVVLMDGELIGFTNDEELAARINDEADDAVAYDLDVCTEARQEVQVADVGLTDEDEDDDTAD